MKRTLLSLMRPVALTAALCAGLFPSHAAAERRTPAPKKVDDPFLNGPPFSFGQLIKLVAQDAIPLHRRKEAVLSRGIEPSITPDQIEKLKAAGASEEMLKAIRSKVKPVVAVVPPPVKKDPVGGVLMTCAPVDCQISLNGTALGSTQDHRLEVGKLHPGKWVVDFSAKGYIGHQSAVVVEADKTIPVAVTLEPNRQTLEEYGGLALKAVIGALAGQDGMDALATVQATGSLTIWSREGSSVRWTMLMRNNPDRALFQAKAGSILHEVAFVGTEFKASKNLKGQDAFDLPTDFGFIRDYQLAAILTKISDPQYKKTANHPVPSADEEYPLVADNGTEKIALGLDHDLRPQRIRITTSTGVGSGIITYGDYFKAEKAFYPKSVQIKPDGWAHGIEVHFDSVDLGAKLNANDFKLRGKALMTVAN